MIWVCMWRRVLLGEGSPPSKDCLVGFRPRFIQNGLSTDISEVQFKEQLKGTVYSDVDATTGGDGMVSSDKENWDKFFNSIDEAISGKLKFTITLKDPMANSYVQDLCLPEVDPQLTIEEYVRSEEEEDDLGLTHMKTEGYEQDNDDAQKE